MNANRGNEISGQRDATWEAPVIVLAPARPIEKRHYGRFADLYAAFLPLADDPVYTGLGLTRAEVEQLPRLLGEVRQIEVEPDAEVAGYIWIELRARTLQVHALLLQEEFRGRGIGARALADLEDEFRGRIDEIELGVDPANGRARRLYERAGFEEVGERLGFLIMRKQL